MKNMKSFHLKDEIGHIWKWKPYRTVFPCLDVADFNLHLPSVSFCLRTIQIIRDTFLAYFRSPPSPMCHLVSLARPPAPGPHPNVFWWHCCDPTPHHHHPHVLFESPLMVANIDKTEKGDQVALRFTLHYCMGKDKKSYITSVQL